MLPLKRTALVDLAYSCLMTQISKPKHTRLQFDLEKLKDCNVLETFQAMIGRKFAPLTIMSNEETDRFDDHHLQQPILTLR